jgi:Domain of unknown function (DUF4105)
MHAVPVARALLVPLAAWLAYAFLIRRPSNQRTWEYGMETLADISINGRQVHVRHVRDFGWGPDGPRSSDYVDRTFDVDRISRVWFIQEPFTLGPFGGFKGVAHTYFVFDFEDPSTPPVAVSVEARREKGETFDAFRGLVNTYELIYIWGTERDVTGSRAVREKTSLYMFPLSISRAAAQQLFLQMAEATRQLATRPRFYNSLTSNCTNELAKAANLVQPGAVPLNIGLIFPGYAHEILYRLGFLPHDLPLDQLRQKSSISDFVKAEYDQPDFSPRLRAYLGAA